MSEDGGGGGGSGMMIVVVLLVAMCGSVFMSAIAGFIGWKQGWFKDLLGPPGASSTTPTVDCNAKAQKDCEGVKGSARGPCISKSKKECAASAPSGPGVPVSPASCGGSVAEFWMDTDYKGGYAKLGCGEYADLGEQGMHDVIESAKIPSNIKVIAYVDNDFKGNTGIFKGNIRKFGGKFHDSVSSMKILPIDAPDPPGRILGEWTG